MAYGQGRSNGSNGGPLPCSEAGNPLARRLQFNDTVSYYGTKAGWHTPYFHMDAHRAGGKIGKPGNAATRGARTSNTGFTSFMSVQ